VLGPKSDNAFSQYAWYVFFKRGWDYAKINDYDRAIADCSEAVRLNSRSEGALFIRAYSSVRKGDYGQGISDYTAVIRLNAKIGGAFRGRASLYFQKGEFDLAIADYTEAIKLEPAIAASHSRRGYAYQAKGDYDQAIADYDEAIRINPSYAHAYNNRGFAYFSKGDMTRAILDYTGAIRLDEEYALSYKNRGIAELYSGSPTKGLADFDLAIQLKPSDLYGSLWREIAAWQANAPSTLGQAASKIDTTAWPAPIIRVYLGESSPADLIASTTSAASQRSDGRLCEVNFFGGQLALHRGSKEEARRALQAAAADCPRHFIEAGAATADLKALGH
jgi:lipoprotein NlpI